MGATPLTQSRALYWRGRTAEALKDPAAAHSFYTRAAQYPLTFYGQLAGLKAGLTGLSLGPDPQFAENERSRFEGRDVIRASRLLREAGQRSLYDTLIAGLSELLPSPNEEAMLVDFTRRWGDQALSMRVARNAARRGFAMPERGFPMPAFSIPDEGVETALVLAIARQESGFDPRARSPAGARGLMQLLPGTARIIGRQIGADGGNLQDPQYNLRLGAAYLGRLIDRFGGSYIMAIAAYNAGPEHLSGWTDACGDPRRASTDPLDFIECIPFRETRDYVMRVLEATEVYRARLNGGRADNLIYRDLKRGTGDNGVTLQTHWAS